MDDTIAAISTAPGISAISIVRLSGEDSIKIVNSIFKGKDLLQTLSHTINYGHIHDNGEIIDEVLVTIMKAPKTFTKEDVVEINCHGGLITTKRVLDLLITNGVRLAEPGEFTKRAFLNNRIDLVEAEGIMDLINAKTEKARKLAINHVNKNVSNLVKLIRDDILKVIANIEVNIDYPEYEDILVVTNDMISNSISNIKLRILTLLKDSENSKFINDGINTVIIGKPNVGKSSLLNSMLGTDKAIVTDIPGTTRDIVEGSITVDGIILNILDTAGIRATDNIIEQMGIQKSLDSIDQADLVILILNNNEFLDDQDLELLEKIKDKKAIIFINKMDLESKLDKNKLIEYNIVLGSIKHNEGIIELKNKISELFNIGEIENGNYTFLSNLRQISLLKEVAKEIEELENGITNNLSVDILEINLKKIWDILGDILGSNTQEELVTQLFTQFCLGK